MHDLLSELSGEDDLGDLSDLTNLCTEYQNNSRACAACFNTFMKGNKHNVYSR